MPIRNETSTRFMDEIRILSPWAYFFAFLGFAAAGAAIVFATLTDRTGARFYRRLLRGVGARFAGRSKLDLHATFFRVHDRGQPELRLRLADPPLTYDEPTHENAAGCM